MRAWWSDYGTYVVAGVVLGAGLLFGLNYYNTSKANAEAEASALYDTLAGHVAEGRLDDAEATIADLNATFADTAYAQQAKLAMARLYMDSNRDADAANVLRELVDSASVFAPVARLRLAKILQYQEKYDDVLALLDGQDGNGFKARYAEARGDALSSLERYDDARAEYLTALADNGQTVDTTFLQLKLLDLPVPEPEAADIADTDFPEDLGETPDAGVADASETETP